MLNKNFESHSDINGNYYSAQEVALMAIRQLFTGIQEAHAEYKGSIRLRKSFQDITPDGNSIYQVSNKGRKVTMTCRAYDVVITSDNQDCIDYQKCLYFSTS
jgi:hypothetical protein